jgi:hypothetical protein
MQLPFDNATLVSNSLTNLSSLLICDETKIPHVCTIIDSPLEQLQQVLNQVSKLKLEGLGKRNIGPIKPLLTPN